MHTAWNHSYSAETKCTKSHLLRGSKLHGITATQWKNTAESHISSEETYCMESQLLGGNTLQKVTVTQTK